MRNTQYVLMYQTTMVLIVLKRSIHLLQTVFDSQDVKTWSIHVNARCQSLIMTTIDPHGDCAIN